MSSRNVMPVFRGSLWLLTCLLLASCRTVLPPEAAPVPSGAPLPERFTARQTVVFEFRPHWWWPTIRLTALGYTSVNRPADEYTVVCLTPMGVKLFDAARTNGHNRATMAFPLPGKAEQAGQAVGDDIAMLYLDLAPPPDATSSRHGDRLTYRHAKDGQSVEWEYSAATGRLQRKTVTGNAARSTVTFGDYRCTGSVCYPDSLTLQNRRYRYRLIVRIQDLQPAP